MPVDDCGNIYNHKVALAAHKMLTMWKRISIGALYTCICGTTLSPPPSDLNGHDVLEIALVLRRINARRLSTAHASLGPLLNAILGAAPPPEKQPALHHNH